MRTALGLLECCSPLVEAKVLELFASLEIRSGHPALAVEPLRRAISIRRMAGGEGLASALIQLADVHSELDQPIEALSLTNQVLASLLPGDEELRLIAMSNGAEYLCEMGCHEEALQAMSNVDTLFARVALPTFYACRDLTLAHIRQGLGHLDLAEQHYREAVAAFQALGDSAKARAAMIELARLD